MQRREARATSLYSLAYASQLNDSLCVLIGLDHRSAYRYQTYSSPIRKSFLIGQTYRIFRPRYRQLIFLTKHMRNGEIVHGGGDAVSMGRTLCDSQPAFCFIERLIRITHLPQGVTVVPQGIQRGVKTVDERKTIVQLRVIERDSLLQ